MPIIIFSSDSYQDGREIAKKTAQDIGYRYVGREILSSVAEKYNIPEARLIKALDESPSFMGMPSKAWNQYLAYIQEAVLGELLDDKVVTCGVAAHLYVLGVSHVLKIRILVDPDEKVKRMAEQQNVSFEKAKKLGRRLEKQRKRWSLDAFKLDETDPSLYDLMINTSQIDSEEAIGLISTATGYKKFRPMTYSTKCMQDRELAGRVRANLLGKFPEVRVQARDGAVVVEIKALKREKRKKTIAVKELVEQISGVHYVEVHVINDIFRQAAESGR
ncbi:MAG: cytidylate kinase-like family protein [Deltaproteobacteria bacterium]|nr:cytidylate kinase-like family protein [Deltaproteobacteria bacterium]